MPLTLVADFESKEKARDAIQHLTQAGISRSRIETYPSVDTQPVSAPSASEKVAGAETELSPSGPMGHMQSLFSKMFGTGKPDDSQQNSIEPSQESADNDYVFLAVEMNGSAGEEDAVRQALTSAGAVRLAEHQT